MQNLEDRRLVKALLKGNEQAFEHFFDENFSRLYRFALVRLSDDPDAAREVAQVTLTKGLQKLQSYRGEARLYTWLCTICRNETTDFLRKRQRERQHIVLTEDHPEVQAAVESYQAPESESPETHYQRGEALRLVQVALDQLPRNYGDVLEWKYIEGYSVKEIAVRLNIGQEATQSMLARAKRAFNEVYTTLIAGMGEALEGRV